MYSGDYLKKGNLGHEVINLYKSDNGNNYIYIMSDGKFNLQYRDRIGCVLLVREISKLCFEILGKATGLETIYGNEKYMDQMAYIRDNNITYAGVPLSNIFIGDDYQDICITFKADKVVRPKNATFVQYTKGLFEDMPTLTGINSGRSPKQYVIPENHDRAHKVLSDIVDNNDMWGDEVGYVDTKDTSDLLPHTIFDICGITHYELAHSKAIGNLLKSDREFADKFVRLLLGIEEGVVGNYTVVMETEQHIDIFITDEAKSIIIENKIKSGINGITIDKTNGSTKTQLETYYEAAQKEFGGKAIYAYLLCPDYNNIVISNSNYKKILYSTLHSIMIEHPAYKNDSNFKIITDAFKRHTLKYDNSLYAEMKRKFLERLSQL